MENKSFIFYDSIGVVLRNNPNTKIEDSLIRDFREYKKTSFKNYIRINYLKGRICTILGDYLDKGYCINQLLVSIGIKDFISEHFSFINEVETSDTTEELTTNIHKIKALYEANIRISKELGSELFLLVKNNKLLVTLSNGATYVYEKSMETLKSFSSKISEIYDDLVLWIKLKLV